ncbi:MAG: glycosyltransferase family 2 protein [Proteobacteria bacterium]|nr:glycosyltransferase family 2 protein [Pseudomonadota bacterium]
MANPATVAVDVSVVVPVYNGAEALSELRQRLRDVMFGRGCTYELILVDDRGQQASWPIIHGLAMRHDEVVGIRLSRNFGQHAATICGIGFARGTWIVTMDDDLEHRPEDLPSMLAVADERHALVYAVFDGRTHSAFRNLTSELMRRMLKRAFPELNQHYSSYRVMHRTLAKKLEDFGRAKPYIDGYLSWMTSSVATVRVHHGTREHGASAYTLTRLLALAASNFVTFSQLPLRIGAYVGTLLASGSFLYMLYIVYGKMSGHISNPGYASLMSVMLFACGVQLLILGVIGEYIGRLMSATYRRPVYIVESTAARGSEAGANLG